MNADFFYNEVKNSDICPNNFDLIYNEFANYQGLTLKTLLELHRICEMKGIKYQLAFGSLIGAVRDDGQVPWDYDVDVVINYGDRYKLIDALKNELSNEYYFYCPEINSDCRHYHMRVTPKGYESNKLHVDVFYLIGAPEKSEERAIFESEMLKYYRYRVYKLRKLKDYKSIRRKLSLIYHKAQIFRYKLKDINNRLNEICTEYDPVKTDTTIVVLSVYGHLHLAWSYKMLWDTEIIKTPKGEFRITKNYDSILKSIYKDYLKIYPLENRLGEMINCYVKISDNKIIKQDDKIGRYYLE